MSRASTERNPAVAGQRGGPGFRRLAVCVVGLASLAAVAWFVWGQPRGGRAENVLLITIDTTRADHLGCFGGADARTPNLDRLAQQGLRFARCVTCSATTLPSHASMMTSVYPYVHGARSNGVGRLAGQNITLAEELQRAGYATGAAVASFVLNRRFGVDQGFDVYHDVPAGLATTPLAAERRGDVVCEDALQMLRGVARERFFLWVHFFDPHHPYVSAAHPDTQSRAAYADEIAFMDVQIGRVLDELSRLGLERKTLVVVVADHGEGLGDHGELTHGYFLYDTVIHVPMIMRCPGVVPAGQTVASQVRTIDIAPTILDLLSLPGWTQAQGVSLRPLLERPGADLHLPAYSEAFDAFNEYGVSPLRSWTDGGWKYIHVPTPELYHVAADAAERQDVAASEPERVTALRAALRQLIADAPLAPTGDEAESTLDRSAQAALESLGYTSAPPRFVDPQATELDRFEPRGVNPRDCTELFVLAMRDLPGLMVTQQHARAEELLRRLLAAMPDAARLRSQLADVLHAQGRSEEAFAEVQRAVATAPGDVTIIRGYGTLLAKTGRYEEALEQFIAALAQVPSDAAAAEQAALACAFLGRQEAAEQYVGLVHQIDPQNTRALRNLGLVHEQQGRLAEALRCHLRALEIDPQCRECEADRQRVSRKMEP